MVKTEPMKEFDFLAEYLLYFLDMPQVLTSNKYFSGLSQPQCC